MKDLEFERQRAEAMALPEPCGYCHALTGERCVNKATKALLEHVPAHFARLRHVTLEGVSE